MKVSKFQPSEKVFKKFYDKIKVEKYEGPAFNKVVEQNRRAEKERSEFFSLQLNIQKWKIIFLGWL